jgi:hypothetical protein
LAWSTGAPQSGQCAGTIQGGPVLAPGREGELGRLAVLESHGDAYLRDPGVGGGWLVAHHHSLDDRALAEERFTLGLGHRLLVRVMTEQVGSSSGGSLSMAHPVPIAQKSGIVSGGGPLGHPEILAWRILVPVTVSQVR